MPFAFHKYLILYFLLPGWMLIATQCGSVPAVIETASTVDGEKVVIQLEAESSPVTKLIVSEKVPLNNCGGNSGLVVDIERKHKFIYAITDEQGVELGTQYLFLTGLLEKKYGVIDGTSETQTYTIHLETKANSYVVYTIEWKEIWRGGRATVKRSSKTEKIPYRVKQALAIEVKEVRNIGCQE